MARYIELDALVAEIERIKKEECPIDSYEGRCKLLWFEQFLSFLNTIEVKEVDLRKPYGGVKVQTSYTGNSLDGVIVKTTYKAQKG